MMFDKLIPWKRSNQHGSGRLSVRHGDDPVTALRRDFEDLLSRFWEEGGLSRRDGKWLGTSVDFDENDKEYVLTAELPGFDPGDIDVKVSGQVLTLKAEHKEEGDSGNGHGRFHRYGSFYESLTLPSGVKADEISAGYHNGILEVHVPKDELAPSKRIEVKAS